MTKTPKTTKAPKKTAAPAAAKPGRGAGKAAPAAAAPAAAVTPADPASAQEAPAQGAGATLAPTTQPTPPKAPRSDGVIATLVTLLRAGGGTKAELYEGLRAKFPERGEGMKTTVAVQLNALPKAGKLVIHQAKDAEGATRYWADPLPAEQVPPAD
ncbi:MAG TPA: hypothetical protein VMB34_21625 [Acetobacteraceae bacterium]|nr:hypothetical protein [Acetobacteraceae bacterium]